MESSYVLVILLLLLLYMNILFYCNLFVYNYIVYWRFDESKTAHIYEENISEVLVTDFNVDGNLDVLISKATVPGGPQTFSLYLGNTISFSTTSFFV